MSDTPPEVNVSVSKLNTANTSEDPFLQCIAHELIRVFGGRLGHHRAVLGLCGADYPTDKYSVPMRRHWTSRLVIQANISR